MKNKIIAISIAILLLLLILLIPKKKIKKESIIIEPTQIITETISVTPTIIETIKKTGKYESKILKTQDGGMVFQILKEGKEIFKKEVKDKFSFIANLDGKNKNLPEFGQDINGDGKKDFVLQLKSEKNSCSNIFAIYSMEDNFKQLAELKGLADDIKFQDLDGDSIPELIANDCTFLNWWGSFGENFAPQVILKLKYGEYKLAENLMRKSPPSDNEINKIIKDNKNSFITYIWKYMLDLIYTGNGELAWSFYERVEWNSEWEEGILENKEGKKISDKYEFLEAFKEHLTTSPYWEDLKKLNGWEMLEIEM